MNTPRDAKTKQGFEMQWVLTSSKYAEAMKGTNVVGHFVFTKELLPLLLAAAQESPFSTRVIWISSDAHAFTTRNIINFEDVNLPNEGGLTRYGHSKVV